jgi:soluble lytic murein transglycosylase-like protein
MRRYLNRVLTAQVLAALAFGVSMAARADLWGYVDETGTARIATRKLDDRYQLFLRGGTSADAPDAATAAATNARAAFERTPVFQRMTGHPDANRFQALIDKHATLQQLDPALVKAVIAVESSFEPDAVSAKGAVGLMQIIPETGERYGVVGDARRSVEQKLRDPSVNLSVGTRYLHDLLALFENDLELALAAYNAGEQTVKRYENTVPPFAETREYVKLVQQFLSFYRPPPPAPAARIRVVIPGRRSALVLSGDAAQ